MIQPNFWQCIINARLENFNLDNGLQGRYLTIPFCITPEHLRPPSTIKRSSRIEFYMLVPSCFLIYVEIFRGPGLGSQLGEF